MHDPSMSLSYRHAMLDLDRLRQDLQLGHESPTYSSFDHRIELILRSVRQHGPLPGHRRPPRKDRALLASITLQAEHRLALDDHALALDSALKGLRLRINDPRLLFLAAQAVDVLGSDLSATRLAYQALWVNPRYEPVQYFFARIKSVHPAIQDEFFGRPSP